MDEAGRQAELALLPFAARRRDELLQTLDELDQQIRGADVRSERRPRGAEAVLLMTHPGVGPQTALAFVLTMGEVRRFANAKKVASYVGLIPREHSAGASSGWGISASRARP